MANIYGERMTTGSRSCFLDERDYIYLCWWMPTVGEIVMSVSEFIRER